MTRNGQVSRVEQNTLTGQLNDYRLSWANLGFFSRKFFPHADKIGCDEKGSPITIPCGTGS